MYIVALIYLKVYRFFCMSKISETIYFMGHLTMQ